jgi:hypothetical protein
MSESSVSTASPATAASPASAASPVPDHLAKLNAHERDPFIEFDPIPHVYTVRGEGGYTSVTTFVHSHFEHFDPEEMDIAKLIKDARADPRLLSAIDVEEILKTAVKCDYLENETMDTISQQVLDSLKHLSIDKQTTAEHCNKLIGYRYVDELHLLHKGKYVRWIRHDEPEKIMRGGIIVDVQFSDFGANVLCRLTTGHFLRYRFDKCNTYQKLTEEEQLYLMFI